MEDKMDFKEFKFLIHRITILSDRCAGLKTQNSTLKKLVNKLQKENKHLEFRNEELGKKLTELNHELQKYKKEHETPSGFHGQINIKGLEK